MPFIILLSVHKHTCSNLVFRVEGKKNDSRSHKEMNKHRRESQMREGAEEIFKQQGDEWRRKQRKWYLFTTQEESKALFSDISTWCILILHSHA